MHLLIALVFVSNCGLALANKSRAKIEASIALDPEPVTTASKGFPVTDLRLMLETRQYKNAEALLSKCSQGYPAYFVNLWKGLDRYKHGESDEACQYFRRCLPLHDVSSWVRCSVGDSFSQSGDYKMALQVLDTVPRDKRAGMFYEIRSSCYIPLHRADEAVADLLVLAKYKGQAMSRIICNAAQVYYGEKRYGDALKLVNLAMQQKYVDRGAAFCRGICYAKLHEDAMAVKDFTQTIEQALENPGDGKNDNTMILCRAYGERAKCYERLGKRSLAQADKVSLAGYSKTLSDDLTGTESAKSEQKHF